MDINIRGFPLIVIFLCIRPHKNLLGKIGIHGAKSTGRPSRLISDKNDAGVTLNDPSYQIREPTTLAQFKFSTKKES